MIATVTLNAAIDKRYVIEKLQPGEVLRLEECSYSAGGKGINVSRVARLSGEEVFAMGFIGGCSGGYIIEELKKLDIECDFTQAEGETRSCINLFEKASKRQTEFLEPGVTVMADQKKLFLETYKKGIAACPVVVISGSAPKGIEPEFYRKLIRIAKNMGKKVILDTSGNLLKEGICEKPYLVKPNRKELEDLMGKKFSDNRKLLKAAMKIKDQGVEIVVVSLGRYGAVAVTSEGVYTGIAPDIPVVNTVGCGDSMVAAFAAGCAHALPVREMLRYGLAFAAANAVNEKTGFFLHEDYLNLLERVEVRGPEKPIDLI